MSFLEFINASSAPAGVITGLELHQAIWLLAHKFCVLYVEFDMVTECVSCGEIYPVGT